MGEKLFQLRITNYELIQVGFEVIDVEDAQFEGTDYEAGSIDTFATREEFANQLHLALLQTLHTKRHTTQTRYLLLRIAQCQVAQETLVVLVTLLVDEGFLTSQL